MERHEQHNAEKIGLSLLLTFGLALIAILCNFFFEFLETYKSDLNTALYWISMTVIIAIGSCLLFTAIYYGSMLWLNFEMKRTKTAHFREKLRTETINNRLADATQRQMEQGIVDTYEQLKASGEFTWNKFTLAIYNKKGGHYVNQLKAVLNAHEIAYS